MVEMARRYKNGYIVNKDMAECEKLLTDAAKRQYPEGLHAYGLYMIENDKEGVEYIRAAAQQKLEDAMLYMLDHEHNAGNFKEAYWYAKELSMKGNHNGTKRMADYYHDGKGVGRDKQLARDLYREAANAGNEEAARILKDL
jgi:TPR repeat protein